jgi:hypothetical protein
MRYETVDTIPFTDINGKTYSIKDMREYEKTDSASILNLKGEKYIDEVTSRKEIFGDGSEFESYKIVDHNITSLFDRNFDLTKLKKLEIPI